MNANELVLGIDGGGTKTVAWLSNADDVTGVPIGRGQGGATNPGVVGLPSALATLSHVIDAAFCDAGFAPGPVRAACLAISGTERSAHRTAFLQWAADRSLAHDVQLVNDAEAVLAGGSPDGWGVALIAGTGSFAFGRDLQGLTVRCGGWGSMFGDEGSGYAIATGALRAAAQHADGRGPETTLLPSLMSLYQLAEPRDLITKFYGGESDPRSALSDLAPMVVAAAAQGDAVARQLADDAASDLAGLVVATCDALRLSPQRFPLAIAGGLVCNSALIRDGLEAALSARNHLTREITLVVDPVGGAVQLARRAARDS